MVVIGDRTSSNTNELVEICKEHCSRVLRVEDASEISSEDIADAEIIGVTAGASTPDWIIKEVLNTMEEFSKGNEYSFLQQKKKRNN